MSKRKSGPSPLPVPPQGEQPGHHDDGSGIKAMTLTAPTITGSIKANEVLTANEGVLKNAVGVTTELWIWLVDGAPRQSSESPLLITTGDDFGKSITVTQQVTDSLGRVISATSQPTVPVAGTNPMVGRPAINGIIYAGRTVTAMPGAVEGVPTPLSHFDWFLNGTLVLADSSSYFIPLDAIEKILTVRHTVTSIAGTSSADSSPSLIALDPLVGITVLVDPSIVGTTTEGERLQILAGQYNPVPQVLTYKWFRGSTEITTATTAFYDLTADDVGFAMRGEVFVSYQDSSITRSTQTTALVKTAAPPNFAPTFTTPATIIGNAVSGNTLSGFDGEISGFPVPVLTRRWLANGVAIGGATGPTLVLGVAQVLKRITYEVTATNSQGVAVSTSAQTAVVTAPPVVGTFEIQSNLSGMEVGNRFDSFDFFISNAMIDDYVARGIRTFRLPFSADEAQEKPFGPLDTSYLANWIPIFAHAASVGARFIIDDHGFGGRTVEVPQVPLTPLNDTTFVGTGWSTFNATLAADGVIENTATQTHTMSKAVTVTAGSVNVTARVELGTKPWLRMIWRTSTDRAVLVDLVNGVMISGPAQSAVPSVTVVSPGVYDISIAMTDQAAGTGTVILEPGNAAADYATFVSTGRSYTGDGVSQPVKVQSCSVVTQTILRQTLQWGTPELPNSAAGDFWGKLVTWLMANVNMSALHGLDFMNEPYLWATDNCFDHMKQCIQAVRAVPGFDKWLYIEGIPWSGARTYWALNPNHHLLTQYDPLNKLIFSVHVYPDWNSSGSNITFPSKGDGAFGVPLEEGPPGAVVDDYTAVNRVILFIEGCEARGVRGQVGEIGIDNTTKMATQGQINVLNLCQQHGIEYCHWSGGPSFAESYFYNLNRRTSDGLQEFTQAVYDEYLGNPAPTIYAFSGLGGLLQNQTTTTFTVRYHGLIKTGTTRVTFSDNGGGGSFVPAFVDLDNTYNNGYNAVATTVYTPNGEQLVKISTTNDAGWTDPPFINFTSETDVLTGNDAARAALQNMYGWKIRLNTYFGPIVRLHRDADGDEQDFGVAGGAGYNTTNVGKMVDTAAINTWLAAGGAPGTGTIVKDYDQSGRGNDRIPVFSTQGGTIPTSIADYPIYVPDDGSGVPCRKWTGTKRMDCRSSTGGVKGHTCLATIVHRAGYNYGVARELSQVNFLPVPFQEGVKITDFNPHDIYEQGGLSCGTERGVKHAYIERWTAGPKERGWNTYRDSQLYGWNNTTRASWSGDYNRNRLNFGYGVNVNKGAGSWTGEDYEFWRFTTDIGEQTALAISALMESDWHTGKPTPIVPRYDINFKTASYQKDGAGVTLSTVITNSGITIDAAGAHITGVGNYLEYIGDLVTYFRSTNFTIMLDVKFVTNANDVNVFDMSYQGSPSVNKPRWRFWVTTSRFSGGSSNAASGVSGFTNNPYSNQSNRVILSSGPNGSRYMHGLTRKESSVVVTSGTGVNPALWDQIRSYASAAGGEVIIERIQVYDKEMLSGEVIDNTWEFIPAKGTSLPSFQMGLNIPMTNGNFYARMQYRELEYWAAAGIKCIRLPIQADLVQFVPNAPLQGQAHNAVDENGVNIPNTLDQLKNVLKWITSRGIYALIDEHRYGTRYIPSRVLNTSSSLPGGVSYGVGSAEHPESMFVDYWTRIAQMCIDEPGIDENFVCLGLMNEPNHGTQTNAQWHATCNAVRVSVRAIGFPGWIMVPGRGNYTSLTGWGDGSPGSNSAEFVANYSDPLGKTAVELHRYFDSDGSGTKEDAGQWAGKSGLYNATKHARANGYKLMIGETGVSVLSNGQDGQLELEEMLSKMIENNDVWWGFTYWAAGASWNQAYAFLLAPKWANNNSWRTSTTTGQNIVPPYGPRPQEGMMRRLMEQLPDQTFAAPVNTGTPTLTGQGIEGQVLTSGTGTWDNAVSYAYLWHRNGVAIGGATASTYTLVLADVGTRVTCRVTATNTHGSTAVFGAQSGIIQAAAPTPFAPVFTTFPTITAGGPLTTGTVMTLTDGVATGYPLPTLSRQWRRNGVAIPGATSSTYTLQTIDLGTSITALVTATNSEGSTPVGTTSLIIPAGPVTAVTFAADTELNVSATAGDLTNVFELMTSVDPTNASRWVVTGRYGTSYNTAVVFYTANDGASFTKTTYPGGSEAGVTCDASGNFYIGMSNDGTFGLPNRSVVYKIAAGAGTITGPTVIGNYLDRTHIHVDTSPGSPYFGRIYYGGRASGLRVYRSADGGSTWASTLVQQDADFNAGFLYGITTAPDGTVYATYKGRNNNITSGGVYAGSNQNNHCVKSTDGGVSWNVYFIFKKQVTAATAAGIGLDGWGGQIAVNPVTGKLHVVLGQGAVDYQQKVHLSSEDQGVTWTNNGAINLGLPALHGPGHHTLHCNALGYLCLGFFSHNGNLTINRYYVIGSKDDGASWAGSTKINTNDSTNPSGQYREWGGDRTYASVSAIGGGFLMTWTSHITADNKYAARVRKMTIGGAPTYYFSTSGNNANDGLTTSTPKQTIVHLNTLTLASGTTVKFNGGQTFSGNVVCKSGVIYTSYGTGLATINAGSGHGLYALNMGCEVRNLIVTGDGTTGMNGVYFFNNGDPTRWIPGAKISNVEVSGFGLNGIMIRGSWVLEGFDKPLIENCVTHGNCLGPTSGRGSAGVMITADEPYTEVTGPAHLSPVIRNCVSYSNTGTTDTNWTGSGILMSGARDGLIEKCVAYENGAQAEILGGGPVGIWLAGCKNTVIQYCESYSNHRELQNGGDGGGFDIDGGCWDCTIQYCYSHDNDGPGYMLYNYTDALLQAHDNNTVRFCVSEDDCVKNANNFSAGITAAADGNMTNFKIYGNTVFQSRASKYALSVWKNGTLSGIIANNIFYGTGTSSLINTRIASNPAVTIRGNSWYHTGTFSMRNGGTNYTSYAAWQTATSHELVSGANVGKTVDPGLTTPGSGGTMFPAITSASSIVWSPVTLLPAYKLTGGAAALGVGRNLLNEFGITPPAKDFYGENYAQNIGAD